MLLLTLISALCLANEPENPRIGVKATDPLGVVLVDDEFDLPWVGNLQSEVGGKTYKLNVVAAQVDGQVQLISGVYKGAKKKALVESTLVAPPSTATTADHVTEVPKHDEQATWTITATWSPVFGATAPDEAVPEEWPERRFFLVWDDARLHHDLDDQVNIEQEVASIERHQAGAASLHLSPFRMVGTQWRHGGFAEGETVVATLDAHCSVGAPPTRGHPFQYFVSKDDLVKVTTRPVTVTHPDGTGFTVAAGVPARQNADGRWLLETGGMVLVADLEEGDVDDVYRPSAHFAVPDSMQIAVADDGRLGTVGGRQVRYSGEGVAVAARSGVRDPLITVRVPCAQVTMKIATQQILSTAPPSVPAEEKLR